jgi:hypothetical protein
MNRTTIHAIPDESRWIKRGGGKGTNPIVAASTGADFVVVEKEREDKKNQNYHRLRPAVNSYTRTHRPDASTR